MCLAVLLVSRVASGQIESASETKLQWTLLPQSCPAAASENPPIACGDYGTFYFGAVSTSSCTPIAGNPLEPLKTYSKSIVTKPFVPDGAGKLPNWVAVIDTEGNHARSVAFLVSELAGPAVGLEALSIDDPALAQTLGPTPTDFHVIAEICSVMNQIEGPTPLAQPPLVINLSVGRKLETGDPADETSCDPNTASCQLAKLLARAKGHGSTIVVALGNERDRMWPANLGSVLGAGQLTVRNLLDTGVVTPAWENPPGPVRALFAGNSLCVENWPAPAGSSYSAATASGLIAEARVNVPGFDPYAAGTLVPRRDPMTGRWGLARNGLMVAGTSTALTDLYDDLAAGPCWSGGTNVNDAIEGAWAPGVAPRNAVAFPSWTSMTFNPAPAEDPCTPCVGSQASGGDSLSLNLSQAAPLDQTKHIDAVHLRVGGTFYALNLSEATRVQLRDATLRTLVLPGMWPNVQTTSDVSIVFSILYAPNTQPPNPPDPDLGHLCASLPPSSCYWISSPMLRQP